MLPKQETQAMPFANYGLDWKFDEGMWGKPPGGMPIPFYDQVGIYIIYWGKTPVYVGRSIDGDNPGIFGRLKGHKEKPKLWKFLTYLWFGLYPVGTDGKLDKTAPPMSTSETVRNLEALLIYLLEPSWQGDWGQYKAITKFEQVPEP